MNKHAFTEESEGSKVRFNILISTWGQSKSMLLEEPFFDYSPPPSSCLIVTFCYFLFQQSLIFVSLIYFSMYECLKIQTYIIGGKKRQVL